MALSHPTRRAVLDLLSQHERSVGDLAAAFPTLSQPAFSKHLRKLRDAGLVSVQVQAQKRIYSLEPKALAELNAWIAKYQTFWPEQFDTLEEHLSTKEKRSDNS